MSAFSLSPPSHLSTAPTSKSRNLVCPRRNISPVSPSNARPIFIRPHCNQSFGEPPDGAMITKALEVSFRNVWLRLMTSGVGEQYNNAIQAFVVACIAAYKAGYSLTALRLELSTRELKSTDTNRDISLTEQEKDTRLVWISLVYLTLARFSFKSERTPPDVRDELAGTKFADLASGLFRLVDTVCEAAKKGYNLDSFKLELRLKMDPADKELSGAQSSIRSQWSRIVFATVSILPDSMK